MKALYRQIALGLLCLALGSVALFYLLSSEPLLEMDDSDAAVVVALADHVEPRLKATPPQRWPELIEQLRASPRYRDVEIEIVAEDDVALTVEELVQLRQDERVQFEAVDGRTVVEFYIAEHRQVVQVYSVRNETIVQGANYAILIGAILLLAGVITLILARPLARRLRQLEFLAERYGESDWEARAAPDDSHPISGVGRRMESMASSIAQVVRQKDALVDDQRHLLVAAAHEFRSPMARLRFALDMNENDLSATHYGEMSRALDELNSLVSEVLRFGRLNVARDEPGLGATDLAEVARSSIARCAKQPGLVPIELDAARPAARVALESHLLERALGNVLINAGKYAANQARLSWVLETDGVLISVEDDGPGIPAADRERVLQAFTRLDTSRTRTTGGHGLGLAIVERIVAAAGGRLAIDDSPLGGARVLMRLPLAT
ncbi:MAG: ATP-binding protein [Pseudomonadota bacterium]